MRSRLARLLISRTADVTHLNGRGSIPSRARRQAVFLVCAISVLAAEKAEPVSLPPALQSIRGLALASPPEFAADALLRLAASPKVRSATVKRELIQQAFQLAAQAHEPSPRTVTDAGDSREAVISAAASLKLDALTLQSRAVEAMSSLDAKEAAAMLSAIPRPELPPKSGGQTPKLELLWQSGTAKRIFTSGRSLWIRDDGMIATDAERSTGEWSRRLTDFLSTLEAWSPGDESSEVVYFHEKAFAYEGVLRFAPAGAMRERVLTAYLGFLAQSNLQQQSPVEWYWHPRSVLDRAPDPQSRDEILAAFRDSGNVILQLEAALDTLTPAGAPKFPLL
jgi:hypothetical protein